MSASVSHEFNDQILTAFEHCLVKMSDRLKDTFDPDDKGSLNLFRQFCSGLRTHLQFVKSVLKQVCPSGSKKKDTGHVLASEPKQDMQAKARELRVKARVLRTQAIEDTLKQFPKTQSLLRSIDRNNGLVVQRQEDRPLAVDRCFSADSISHFTLGRERCVLPA